MAVISSITDNYMLLIDEIRSFSGHFSALNFKKFPGLHASGSPRYLAPLALDEPNPW